MKRVEEEINVVPWIITRSGDGDGAIARNWQKRLGLDWRGPIGRSDIYLLTVVNDNCLNLSVSCCCSKQLAVYARRDGTLTGEAVPFLTEEETRLCLEEAKRLVDRAAIEPEYRLYLFA